MTTPFDSHAIIEISGRMLDSWAEPSLVTGVEVGLSTNATSQAEFRVYDPDPGFPFISSITSAGGVAELPVRVWLGFGPRGGLGEPVFKGLSARVEYHMGITSVTAFDMGFRMKKFQKSEYHSKVNDLQLIEKLARRNGLGFEGPDRQIKLEAHKSYKQEGTTDWDEALSAAERAGLEMFVRDDVLFAKEAAKTAESPLLTLTYRRDFLLLDDFHLAYRTPEDQEGRPAAVETRGRGRGGRRLRGESEKHERGAGRLALKRDLHRATKRHADQRAEARKLLQREHAFEASVAVLPSFAGPRPRARDTVALAGLPELFNQKWLCEQATHVFEPGELSLELDLYRDVSAGK